MLEPSGTAVFIAILLQAALFVLPILGLYVVWRFLRVYERRGQEPRATDALATRIAQLEETVADLTTAHERLAEEHRFLTHLLAERKDGSSSRVP